MLGGFRFILIDVQNMCEIFLSHLLCWNQSFGKLALAMLELVTLLNELVDDARAQDHAIEVIKRLYIIIKNVFEVIIGVGVVLVEDFFFELV